MVSESMAAPRQEVQRGTGGGGVRGAICPESCEQRCIREDPLQLEMAEQPSNGRGLDRGRVTWSWGRSP